MNNLKTKFGLQALISLNVKFKLQGTIICRNYNLWHFEVQCSVNFGVKHAVSSPKGPNFINNRALVKKGGGEWAGGEDKGNRASRI